MPDVRVPQVCSTRLLGNVEQVYLQRLGNYLHQAFGKKAFFYRIENEVKTKEYLLPGSFVLATKKKKGFSFVRYVDPDSQIDDDDPKRVVSGWIRTSSLVNPFPLKGKQ